VSDRKEVLSLLLVKVLLAVFLPALLVVLFTRVTYSLYVGMGLTIALFIGSMIKGYTEELYIILIDVISIGIGFLYARRMVKKFR
jgi:general stress protein CsbA